MSSSRGAQQQEVAGARGGLAFSPSEELGHTTAWLSPEGITRRGDSQTQKAMWGVSPQTGQAQRGQARAIASILSRARVWGGEWGKEGKNDCSLVQGVFWG